MNIETISNLIVAVLSGLAVCIPVVIKLVKYVQESIKEKNWTNVLQLVMNLMKEAEAKYSDGASKKEYVLAGLHALANTLNYEINYDIISQMIDSMCSMAKEVNTENK